MEPDRLRGETVVVPWDGSAAAREALEEGARLAAGGRLVLVHVQGAWSRTVASAALVRDKLRASIPQILRGDLEVRIDLASGDPLQAILETIESESATLAVIGTRGRSKLASRSLSVALLRAARIPVVVTRVLKQIDPVISRPRVIVGIDFSPASREAAVVAARLAKRRGAWLTLLHVLTADSKEEPSQMRHQLEALASTLDVERGERSCFVFTGTVADALVDETEGAPEAWIVVGTRERGAVRRTVAGSVAEELIRRAPGPVVVAHAPARRRTVRVAFDSPPLA